MIAAGAAGGAAGIAGIGGLGGVAGSAAGGVAGSSGAGSGGTGAVLIGGAAGVGAGGSGAVGATGGTWPSGCGDGSIDDGEECDDGGNISNDGCSADCTVECPAGSEVGPTFHCYWKTSTPLNWPAARIACESAGAHLMSITTAEENDFIAALTAETLWIGGWDQLTPGQSGVGDYVWVSGQEWIYENWGMNQPSASPRSCGILNNCYEHCATLTQDGTWNDRHCEHDEYPYLCELAPRGTRP